MSTTFNTFSGYTTQPLTVEVITPLGREVGLIGNYEELTMSVSIKDADILDLVLPMDGLAVLLSQCDGSVLVSVKLEDKTYLFMPTEATAESVDGAPDVAQLHITCSGGWTLLDGQAIPPSLEEPVEHALSTEFHLAGTLEQVIKRLITVGTLRLNHPVYVLTSQDRGPQVEVSGAWDSAAELVRDLLNGTGYFLQLQGWVPGDPFPMGQATPYGPAMIVDVVPFRDRETLWTTQAGDITKWSLSRTRPTATRVTLGHETDTLENRTYYRVTDGNHAVGWHHRELYQEFKYDHPLWADKDATPDHWRLLDQMEVEAKRKLAEAGSKVSLSAEVDVANLWRFSQDRDDPRAFDLGDLITVEVPYLGRHRAVVTDVEVKATADTFSVVPSISTPDTMSGDVFTRVSDLSRRVHNLERKK